LNNSVSAMIDDILTDDASAQLMVANDTQAATAAVGFQALQLGQREYIIGITIPNSIIIMLVLAEAIRTRGWKGLVDFNNMDRRDPIIASSRGGEGIAVAADYKRAWGETAKKKNGARVLLIRLVAFRFYTKGHIWCRWSRKIG
jgi:hypothetical protein